VTYPLLDDSMALVLLHGLLGSGRVDCFCLVMVVIVCPPEEKASSNRSRWTPLSYSEIMLAGNVEAGSQLLSAIGLPSQTTWIHWHAMVLSLLTAHLVHGRSTSYSFPKNKTNWLLSILAIVTTFIIRWRSSHYWFVYATVRRLVSWCIGTPCPHSSRKPFVFSITSIASTAYIPVVFHVTIYNKWACFPTSWLLASMT
jgi:hypothetical protein